MSNFIRSLQALGEIVANPTSNLTVALLLLAIVILAVLLVVVMLLMIVAAPARAKRTRTARFTSRRARDTTRARLSSEDYEYPELAASDLTRPATRGRLTRFALSSALVWVVIALVIAGFVSAYAASSRDQYCALTCHTHAADTRSRTADVHRTVACVACHEHPGIAGLVDAVVNRPIHALSNTVLTRTYSAPVSSSACLACHASDMVGVITDPALGVRVSHAEPLAAGMVCADCHVSVGHSETTATAGMSACIRCHDSRTARSDCVVCHVGDTSRAVRTTAFTERLFPKRRLPPVTTCGGCHNETKCDACHGLRLPHPERFVAWEHARQAGFGKKALCYRCHSPADCTSRCHDRFESHVVGWVDQHRTGAPTSLCSCHWYKLPPEGQAKGSFCKVCH